MKKKIALLLCFVLAAFSFIGCSEAELAYLEMGRQMSSETSKVTGVFAGEIDFDALAALANKTTEKLAKAGMYTSERQADAELSELGLKGTQKIKVHYNALMDMKDKMAFYADFDVEFNNKVYSMGDLYFDASKGMYFSKELVVGIYDFYKDMVPSKWDSYYYSNEYREDLLKSFKGNDYIFVGYFDGMSPEEKAQIDAMMGSLNQEIYDEAYNFLTTAFSGFSTDALSKINGGYKISLDGKQMKTLVTDMLQYMIDNIDKVMGAYKDYTLKILEYTDMPEAEAAEAKAAMEEVFGPESQIVVSSMLAGVKQMIISAEQAGYLDVIDGLKYEATVQESSENTFKQREETSLKDNQKTVFSFISESELVIQPVTIDLPQPIISLDDIEKGIKALEHKYNPVKLATITWWNYDLGDIVLKYEREKNSPVSDKLETQRSGYIIKESRLYVPLRSISETLGENVDWDPAAKKAYVVRGNQQIDMTGIIKEGRTYIKIRDFEKLGYKITYKFDEGLGEHSSQLSR